MEPVLHATTGALVGEIRSTLDFFRSATGAERIDRLFVCGGGSLVAGLLDALRQRLDIATVPFDPFRLLGGAPQRASPAGGSHRASYRRGGRGPRAAPGGRPVTRVNLLRTAPVHQRKAESSPDRRRGALACGVILTLTSCGLGWWGLALHRHAARVDGELAARDTILRGCAPVAADAGALERASRDIQERIDVLLQLRASQRAPVRVLEEIGARRAWAIAGSPP